MSRGARARRFLGPLLAVAAVGLVTWGLVRGSGLVGRRTAAPDSSGRPAATQEAVAPARPPFPTPGSPAVDRLRAAMAGANIVICVIDAARADHLGCYGYPRTTTPNIDRLAKQSLVFEHHFSQFPQTYPSTASMFTSQYPDTHLAYNNRLLDASAFTMQEGLREAGFHTAVFSTNPWVLPATKGAAHFDTKHLPDYPPPLTRTRSERGRGGEGPQHDWIYDPDSLLEPMGEWLASQPPSPFFAYIHFIPPHGPYDAPESMKKLFAGREPPNARRGSFEFPEVAARLAPRNEGHRAGLAEWINLYDANLLWADWAVGQVEALLRGAGVFGETLFVVTSDHGEAFGEHGYTYHGAGVYDELVHVPLLIRFPGDDPPADRIGALTGTIDLLPTIFDLLEIGYPVKTSHGISLLPLLTGEATKVRDYVFARDAISPASYVVRGLREALVLYEGGELQALYDLVEDPGQTRNVIDQHAGRAADLVRVFREFAVRQRRPPREFSDPGTEPFPLLEGPSIEFSEEEQERLEALGYLK